MSENAAANKKVSLEDYILVEMSRQANRKATLGKTKLGGLDSLLLPVSDSGPVGELEEEIYYLSGFLTNLSSDFAATHPTFEDVDAAYETKTATNYMLSDPSLLKEDRIEEMVLDAGLVTTEAVDDALENEVDEIGAEFDKADNKVDNWF